MSEKTVLKTLAAEYPLLWLNPDVDDKETYRRVVLQGEEPEKNSLSHYRGSENDRMETARTPAGPGRVVTLGDRQDFELVIRGLMAAKSGPLTPVPKTQGAAMLTVFNWPRIKAHLAEFPAGEQNEEFRRFTSVRENYIDMLIVLSRGPYSGVSAREAGAGEDEWLALSDTIRRFHELTHVICRRMYPDNIDAVRDELIADAVGLYAAYGYFDPEMEKLFLGIRDGQYLGGRLENYTDEPEKLADQVSAKLGRMREIIDGQKWEDPFDMIPALLS